jgi:hypothetical protein
MTEELQNNEEDGQPIGAMADHNSSVTVYKTKDFDPANPVYKVNGKCPDAQAAFMGAKSNYNSSNGSGSLFDKENWQDIVKDIMQMQYRAGNLEGYLHYKWFWDFLDK